MASLFGHDHRRSDGLGRPLLVGWAVVSAAVLGLDLGASTIRALIVDEVGQVLGRGQATYPTLHPQPGFDEQQPDDWYQAMEQAVGNARRFAPAAEIVAIGITGQMHGTVLVGESREPLAPAIVSSDRRTLAWAEELSLGPDLPPTIGGPLNAGYQALTLAWLRRNAPHLIASTRHVLLPVSYLGLVLTGQLVTAPSDAVSTGLVDIATGAWSEEISDTLNIDRGWLPPIRPEGSLIGYLAERPAAMLQLPAGIPVHHGGGSVQATAIATGVTTSGDALVTINASTQVLLPAATPQTDPEGRWYTWPAALPEPEAGARRLRTGHLLNGGRVLEWLQRTLAPGVAISELLELAQTSPVGARGLLFLPNLPGERSSHLAQGAFIGLTVEHSVADMMRAAIEGLALSVADNLDRLTGDAEPPARIVIAGGGASAFVRQIVASVLDQPLEHSTSQDGPALGAARIAAHQLGLATSRMVADWGGRTNSTVLPHPTDHEVYADRLELFREAVDCTLPVIRRLQQT